MSETSETDEMSSPTPPGVVKSSMLADDPHRESILLSKKKIPRRRFLRNAFRTAVGLAALRVVGPDNQPTPAPGGGEAKAAGEQPAAAPEVPPQHTELGEIAKGHGFEMEVAIDAPNGPELLHIRQRHFVPGEMQTPETRKSVVVVQRSIEALLTDLQEHDPSTYNLMVEAVSKESMEADQPHQDFYNELSSVAHGPDAYSRAFEQYEQKTNQLKEAEASGSATLIDTHFTDGIYARHIDMLNKYFNPEQLAAMSESDKVKLLEEKAQVTETITRLSEEQYDVPPEDLPYLLLGAPRLMRLEGRAELLPSESFDAHKEHAETVLQLVNEDGEVSVVDLVLFPVRFQMGSEKRENSTIQLATQSPDTRQIIPLVYGGSHDFERNINWHNKKHPDSSLGLITLTHNSLEANEQ